MVLDTHAFVWVMEGDRKLGPGARRAVLKASADNGVAISAITPWEIAMLENKGRLRLAREVGEWIRDALRTPAVRLLPISPEIAVDSVRLPGAFHPDPADRLIVATARQWSAPLMTADKDILDYAGAGHVVVVDASR